MKKSIVKEKYMYFKDRSDAGKQLATKLMKYRDNPDVMVLGLPRGGVVTAYEVAHILHVPLDIVVPRKIGAPYNPELAVGAIAQSGEPYFNRELMRSMGLTEHHVAMTVEAERKEAQRRIKVYRAGKEPLNLTDKTVILVDDGIATGATMHAAIISARDLGAHHIVVAVPVGPADVLKELEQEVDAVIYLYTPPDFWGVGQFYGVFQQVEDEQVIQLLTA